MKLLLREEWIGHYGKFLALWTDAAHAYALYEPGELVAIALRNGAYPALSSPAAAWYQRFAHDLNGHIATNAADTRPAIEQFRDADGTAPWPEFSAPEAEGVHQIAVGPVHAAIIEPAHFRFSVIGEQVLKLEARFGYSHKGTLALMRGKSPRLAARFAARVSGDATVAHALAFAHAAEQALEIDVPARAQFLRAIMAELERIANHLGDVGALTADAGFPFLDARFALARERVCAACAAAFGHRLMMDMVIPGGVAGDISASGPAAILGALDELAAELPSLIRVFEDYASLQDRLSGTGIIPPALAASYAPGGFVGRASGQADDARQAPGYAPYGVFGLEVPVESAGDVGARIRVRLAEIRESIRLLRDFLSALPDSLIAIAPPSGSGIGLGVAESFRGAIWVWLTLESGSITDIFIADPSARHWPLLEHAAKTAIIADFPLINKSINASYSGVDL